jgi:hypothetical protein
VIDKVRFSLVGKMLLYSFLMKLFSIVFFILVSYFVGAPNIPTSNKSSLFLEIVSTVFILPVFEEFVFRYFSSKNTGKVFNSISFIFFLVILSIINNHDLVQLSVTAILFILAYLFFIYTFKPYTVDNDKVYFLISSFAFMIYHMFLYEQFDSSMIIYSVQFFIHGYLLIVIRTKYGFFYSILTHISFNLLSYIPLLILKFLE